MRTIPVYRKPVRAVAVSPDGRYLAVVAGTHRLAVWDLPADSLAWLSGDAVGTAAVAFAPDGRRLATAGFDPRGRPRARLWDTATGAADEFPLPVGRVGNTEHRVSAISPPAFSPDGTAVLVGAVRHSARTRGRRRGPETWDGLVHRWDAGTGDPLPPQHVGRPYRRVATLPGPDRLVGLSDAELHVWDADGTTVVDRYLCRRGTPAYLSASADGTRVAFGASGQLHVLDIPSKSIRFTVADPNRTFPAAALHPSGRWLAVVTKAGTVDFWDVDRDRVDRVFDWSAGPLRCVAFSPDGLFAACGTATGAVVLFDTDV